MTNYDRADKTWLRRERSLWPAAFDIVGTLLLFAAVVGVFAVVLLEWVA